MTWLMHWRFLCRCLIMGSSFHLLSHCPASAHFAENLWFMICFAFSSLFGTFAIRISGSIKPGREGDDSNWLTLHYFLQLPHSCFPSSEWRNWQASSSHSRSPRSIPVGSQGSCLPLASWGRQKPILFCLEVEAIPLPLLLGDHRS